MIGRIQGWLFAAAAAIAAIAAAWFKGRGAGLDEAGRKRAQAYINTVERARNADLSIGDDAADRSWLHERAKR